MPRRLPATLSGTTTISATSCNGICEFTDLAFDHWGYGFELTFTATTVDGTVMTSTNTGPYISVYGTAMTLAFTTEPAGCVAGIACTTQPVVKLYDTDGAEVTDDDVSGITSVSLFESIDTGCDEGSNYMQNTYISTSSSSGSGDITNAVATFSSLTFSQWAMRTRIQAYAYA